MGEEHPPTWSILDPCPLSSELDKVAGVAKRTDEQTVGVRFEVGWSVRFEVGWPILVWLTSTVEELWIVILFMATGWIDEFLPCLTLAAIFVSCGSIPLVYIVLVTCYQKIRVLWGKEDYIRFMCFGDDYWTPLPNYEWGGVPLNITLRIWDSKKGWGGMDNSETDKTLPREEVVSKIFDSESATEQYEEEQYISRQKQIAEPKLVVNICYLLEENNNKFLYESMDWFTSAFTCPIHLTMNARGEGIKRAWVPEKVREVQNHLLKQHRGQVHATFSDSSRSKAENCNLFGELVSAEKFDYVLRFDIDDRPTYSERSLIKCAESIIGTTRNGFKIVGLQGACIDCYESRAGLGGIMECYTEWAEHMERDQTRARVMGHIWNDGSNMIAETWVFKKYNFNPSLLLEDKEWTLKLLRDGNALAYFPMAVAYGQLAPSFSAIQKRRKRWTKGGMQLIFHAIKNEPMNYFTRYFHCWAYLGVFSYFIWFPMFVALILFGFVAIGRKCQSQTGSFFFLDPDQTEAELMGVHGVRILVWLWNYIGFTNLIVLVCVVFAHLVNTLKFWNRGKFLNARQGYKWFFLQIGYILFDVALMLLFPLLRFKTQADQFYKTEMLMDLLLGRTPIWEHTEKKCLDE